MESFHSRFKGENRSLFLEAPSVTALRAVVQSRVGYYNRRRRHSALGNQPPLTFLAHWKARR